MALKSALETLLPEAAIQANSAAPKHRQVYDLIRTAILEGRLAAHEALPSTRNLARLLRVSRNTVMTAYDLLLGEGYAISRAGAGTFVAPNATRPLAEQQTDAPEPRPMSAIADVVRVWRLAESPALARPFMPSSPAFDAFPFTTWSRIVGRLSRRDGARLMADGDPLGHLGLRTAIANHLRTVRSCACDPEQIVITSGSQLALYLCSLLLMDPGDAVWCEEPGYPRARLTFRMRTNRVIPVPVSDGGIDIEAGKQLSPRPRIIYSTPTHQWPLGITMPVSRRLALLEFASHHGAWVIEDDFDGDLRFDGRAYTALQGLDQAARVIHLGSFSKTILPSIRIGYAVVPYDLLDSFVAARAVLDRFPGTIAQAAVAEFIEGGFYARHIHEMRALYRERHLLLHARLASKLGGVLEPRPAPAGTFTTVEAAPGIDDGALVQALDAQNIAALPLSMCYARPDAKRHGLILGHAVSTPAEIREGVDTIARVLSAWRPAAAAGKPAS